jgi:hypothetical protein
MLTKEEFLDEIRHESKVLKHLATTLLPGTDDWRPTPKQRSVLELLRYLTCCASVPVHAALAGNWDAAKPLEAAAEKVSRETFAAAIDAQTAELTRLLAGVPEADFRTRRANLPWGVEVSLGRALVDMGLKPLVAYRMQLFLYAKASGNAEIGPADCWVGVAAPKA